MPQKILHCDNLWGYSVCSYANRYVFVSGGGNLKLNDTYQESRKNYKRSKKVFRIDLATDTWKEMPDMNYGRAYHASCIAGNTMYVYRGYRGHSVMIEMLKIDEEVLNREVLKSSGK